MSKCPTIEDVVLAHRYLYYIRNRPIVGDFEYDVLERLAAAVVPEDSPINKPGSSRGEDYPTNVRRLASRMLGKHLDRVRDGAP